MNTYSKCPDKRSNQPRRNWTEAEVRQACKLYQRMLSAQVAGEKFVKAPAVRALAEKLQRSKGSVEAKLMNISGVRSNMGQSFVTGYKPLTSYAQSMVSIVAEIVRD